jgi:hypothetical protein
VDPAYVQYSGSPVVQSTYLSYFQTYPNTAALAMCSQPTVG